MKIAIFRNFRSRGRTTFAVETTKWFFRTELGGCLGINRGGFLTTEGITALRNDKDLLMLDMKGLNED